MKGDFSRRPSRNRRKNYESVLEQQGRVRLDADANEQADIVAFQRETRTADVVGVCGAPVQRGGFDIDVFDKSSKELCIAAGRFYAAGQLCEPRLHTKMPVIDFPEVNKVKLARPAPDGREFTVGEWIVVGCGPGDTRQEARISAVGEDGTLLTLNPKAYSGDKPAFGYVERLLLYSQQLDYPGAPAPEAGQSLVYLDVWKRHITAVEDPEMREKALLGPDTTTRVQTVSQVKLFALSGRAESPFRPKRGRVVEPVKPPLLPVGKVSCCEAWKEFEDDPANTRSTGRLRTSVTATPAADLCHFAAQGGYAGLENRLYRVEVHNPGKLGAATFKWSRDNSSSLFPITGLSSGSTKVVMIDGVRKDQFDRLHSGCWVEVLSDDTELAGKAGLLVKIAGDYSATTSTVELEGDVTAYVMGPHPKLRLWDGVLPISDEQRPHLAASKPLELEDGVSVAFAGTGADTDFRPGDYWVFAARSIDRSVEELNFEMAQGIEHTYCPLALVTWDVKGKNGEEKKGDFRDVIDCRRKFVPLTDLVDFSYLGGDGQEARPGQPLAQLLRVGVTMGRWPLGREPMNLGRYTVRFQAPEDNGHVAGKPGDLGQAGSRVEVPVKDGIAACAWLPSADGDPSQQVVATLLDDCRSETGHPPITFTANLSLASQVSYDPGECSLLNRPRDKATNVQAAIDGLCAELFRFFYVSGDGQEGQPEMCLPQQLQVGVMHGTGPVQGVQVTFEFAEDSKCGSINGEQNRCTVLTDDSGIASCTWTLGPREKGLRPRVKATWPRPVGWGDYTPIYFNASFRDDCREPGFHVKRVRLLDTGATLEDDAPLGVDRLTRGLVVEFDEAVDKWFDKWFEKLRGYGRENAPVCYVTLDVPFPFVFARDWGAEVRDVVGFQRLTLAGGVSRDPSEPKCIRWAPTSEASRWLHQLFEVLQKADQGVTHLLTRLVLRGSFIWTGDEAKVAGIYLDGNTFGGPGKNHVVIVSSGDGKRGGDFETWFWLTQSKLDLSEPVIGPAGIRLPFNLTVDPSSVILGRTLSVIADDGTPVRGTIEVNPEAPDIVVFKPERELASGKYRVVVAGGAEGVKSTGKQILDRERIFNLVVPRDV